MKDTNGPQGQKTHEQQIRILERKDDPSDGRIIEKDAGQPSGEASRPDRDSRPGDFPVSRRGGNQESDHNKHNHPESGPTRR